MSEEPTLHRGISRRSFLKSSVATAGVVAAGSSSLAALAAGEDGTVDADEHVYTTGCRGNCMGRCPINVVVREGRVVQARRVKAPAGMENWESICQKGLTTPLRVYEPDRVLYPMKRKNFSEDAINGELRGVDEFERITWDEAIDIVARNLKKTAEKYGKESVCTLYSYGSVGYLNGVSFAIGDNVGITRFATKFGYSVFESGGDRGGIYSMLFAGFCISGNPEDFQYAKTILVLGTNPGEAAQNDWIFIKKGIENGAKLIVVDPVYTIAASKAHLWLPVLPGTDAYMFNAWTNWVIDHKLYDEEFLQQWTIAPLLVKEDGSYLSNADLAEPVEGADGTLGLVWDAAEGKAVAVNTINKPAIFGTFEVQGIKVRTCLQMALDGIKGYTIEYAAEKCDVEAEKLEEAIRLYTTNQPASAFHWYGLTHYVNAGHTMKNMALMVSVTGNFGQKGRVFRAFGGVGYFPVSMEECAVDGVKATPTATIQCLQDAIKTGKIGNTDFTPRALWVCNSNCVTQESGRQQTIEVFRFVDFAVGLDVCMTDTMRHCDVVLPIVNPLEAEDMGCNNNTFRPFLRFFPKVIEPLGEAKSDIDIYRMVSKAMGEPNLYPLTDEQYLRSFLDVPGSKELGTNYDNVKKVYENGGIIPMPWQTPPMPDEGRLCLIANGKDRLDFYNDSPVFTYPVDLSDTVDLDQIRSMDPIHPNEAYMENPLREKYPLFMLSYHGRSTTHAQYPRLEWLRELDPEPVLWINTKDAAERGIKTGDKIKAFNDRGFAVLKAVVTDAMRPHVTRCRQGWWADQFEAGHIQDLTNGKLDAQGMDNSYNDVLIQVELYKD